MVSWFPIRRSSQMFLAELLAQSLLIGMSPSSAIELSARVVPGFRIRRALRRMQPAIEAGSRWDRSLVDTGIKVQVGLVEALRVGQDRGHLAEELHSFAQSQSSNVGQRLIRAVGRPINTVRFAQALSRILMDHSLTVSAVRDAGRVAASGDRSFLRAVDYVATFVEDGFGSFGDALGHQPRHFDLMFCRFAGLNQTRQSLRFALRLLAGEEVSFAVPQPMESRPILSEKQLHFSPRRK